MAALGGTISVAGVAIMFRKRWGFLVFAFAAGFGALGPWILKLFGLSKYPYERADIVETVVLLALALLAIRGFLSGARRNGTYQSVRAIAGKHLR